MNISLVCALFLGCITAIGADFVPKWDLFEKLFESKVEYRNPVQETALQVIFKSPSANEYVVDGFWDGGKDWRIRFSPDEIGEWSYATKCTDTQNSGLHGKRGIFQCSAPRRDSRFTQHGPLKVSKGHRSLAHADGTPFFWLADTAWNGALLSTQADWSYYLKERVRQRFTAVQWVTTQWRAAPEGNLQKQLAYSGREKIMVHPEFFQELDKKVEAVHRSGLLNVPTLLWAINGGSNPTINPGVSLSEEQAILLARYMVARWEAYHPVWFLGGDGDYRGAKAQRWKNIGRAVFGNKSEALVTMHPGGMHWVYGDFKDETWYRIVGYQSGHGDDERTLRWMIQGPLTVDWKQEPPRPFINLEPPYENHISYQSKTRISPETVRRAIYWTLLNAPTAGITYGGHGIWGWDDGTRPPTDHANSGVPLPWKEALTMPGAEQMAQLIRIFTSVDFWRLKPAPQVLAIQPGEKEASRFIASARSDEGDLVLVYVPHDRSVDLRMNSLPPGLDAIWINPRTGEKGSVVAVVNADVVQFATPSEGDWVLILQSKK